ncbi:MAG: guanylate kinase [Chloroflexota bacterium]
MSETPPLLVVISGPSGAGKDAVLECMKFNHPGWHFVVTATTRPKRPGERDGVDYLFLEPSEFQALLAQDGFLEHAQVYGRYYGVPRGQVEEAIRSGKDVIVKTDVQGARTIRAKLPDALLVFLAPPDIQELERRLRQRKSESAEEMQRRIQTAQQEMDCQGEFDHVVVNHNGLLDETVAEIERIILGERRKRTTRP